MRKKKTRTSFNRRERLTANRRLGFFYFKRFYRFLQSGRRFFYCRLTERSIRLIIIETTGTNATLSTAAGTFFQRTQRNEREKGTVGGNGKYKRFRFGRNGSFGDGDVLGRSSRRRFANFFHRDLGFERFGGGAIRFRRRRGRRQGVQRRFQAQVRLPARTRVRSGVIRRSDPHSERRDAHEDTGQRLPLGHGLPL